MTTQTTSQAGDSDQAQDNLKNRINRAVALLDLGLVEQASDELRTLLPELESHPSTTTMLKGFARHQLAHCEWLLGDFEAALGTAEVALLVYSDDRDSAERKQQIEQLVTVLRADQLPPMSLTVDPAAELERARIRFRARTSWPRSPSRNQQRQYLIRCLDLRSRSTKSWMLSIGNTERQTDRLFTSCH